MLSGGVLLLATTYAFIEGGRSGAGSPQVLTAAAVGVAAQAVLATAELRRGDDAMLPPTLLRRPAFTAANTTAGIMNLCTLVTLFVLMLFLQSVQHRPALLAGLTVVPLFAPLAVMAPVGGRITSRFGPRLPAAAGLLVAASGLALLTRSEAHSGYVDLLSAFLLWGTGCGLLPPTVAAIGIAVAGSVAGQPGDQARFPAGLPCRRAGLGLPLRGRRGAGADSAARSPDTDTPALMRSGPLRMQGAARTQRVCVLTDLLPDRRWGEGFGRPLPLLVAYPFERDSHPSAVPRYVAVIGSTLTFMEPVTVLPS